jgi:hypothetical protein
MGYSKTDRDYRLSILRHSNELLTTELITALDIIDRLKERLRKYEVKREDFHIPIPKSD